MNETTLSALLYIFSIANQHVCSDASIKNFDVQNFSPTDPSSHFVPSTSLWNFYSPFHARQFSLHILLFSSLPSLCSKYIQAPQYRETFSRSTWITKKTPIGIAKGITSMCRPKSDKLYLVLGVC